jgi:hypothetical protein
MADHLGEDVASPADLADQPKALPARYDPQARSLMGPPGRGLTAAYVEGHISLPSAQALDAVRASIERQTGLQGHRQGEDAVDIVADGRGFSYCVRSHEDGEDASLVRVDIDHHWGKGVQKLLGAAFGGTSLLLVLAGWWLSKVLLVAGLGVGVLGWIMIARHNAKLRRAIDDARAIAAEALLDADVQTPITGSLPPADERS